MRLLILDREPKACLASWLSRWGDRRTRQELVCNFVASSHMDAAMERYARQAGVATIHYVYELSKQPDIAIKALFAKLGVSELYRPTVIRGGKEYEALESAVSFFEEPAVYRVGNFRLEGPKYHYKHREPDLSDEDEQIIADYAIDELYRSHLAKSLADLGLTDITRAQTRLRGNVQS